MRGDPASVVDPGSPFALTRVSGGRSGGRGFAGGLLLRGGHDMQWMAEGVLAVPW